MSKTPLPKDYFLSPYYKTLTHKTWSFNKKHMTRVVDGPGIYGIFVKNKRKKDGLGQCLYVGQSNSIKRRINQHKKNFVKASNHIKGLKAYHGSPVIIEKPKVEIKYYKMAKDYYLSDLKFVTLYKVEKKDWDRFNEEQRKVVLTMLEQAYIDILKPKTNSFAARPSYI